MGDDKARARLAAADPLGGWGADPLLAQAFAEQAACLRAVYALAGEVVRPPAGAAPEYAVRLGEIPAAFFTPGRNIFSTLFQATYLALGIPPPRRLLYGKLNHLFRIWVTSADNLLDDEEKCVLPLAMPGSSRVMREVVAIMAADRVLWHLLDGAVAAGTVSAPQAAALADESLRCLLPSAAQEGSEEGGVTVRPAPEHVLDTLHVLKTGLLFNIPFMGGDIVETEVDLGRVARLKRALLGFGGGCQILDDVRDLARDFVERRHNYVLSVLAQERPGILDAWSRREIKVGDRLYFEVLPVSLPAARLGCRRLADACALLREEGVIAAGAPVAELALAMFKLLDLEDLVDAGVAAE
ncbi:MAG: hypothetical protein WC789_13695 [Lentisphaeria bacterium]|jgi:hypothetical protein